MALLGTVIPLPIAGLHKFYLGQPTWGVIYLLLGWSSPIARIACAIDAVWYLVQDGEQFQRRFNLEVASGFSPSTLPSQPIDPNQVGTMAEALRQLDQLREDGLVSEYEFEQKRRQLLDRIK